MRNAKQEVEGAQAESEVTRDEPLPEHVIGERRGRSVVQYEQGMSLREGIERLAADADRLRRLAAASEVA
ncbi:MAG: hypothetical protein ACRDRU_18020 [Pseudonocardiaceae bacterium]